MYAVSFAFDFHSSECPAPWCAPPHRNIAENCTTVCHLVLRLEIPLLTLLLGMGMAMEIDLTRERKEEREWERGFRVQWGPMQPCSCPLPFALSPTIYSYILLWRIFSAKVFLARLTFPLVLWMKTFPFAFAGVASEKGVAFALLFVSAMLPHFIFTHFLRVFPARFSVRRLLSVWGEGGLMGREAYILSLGR